MSDSQSPASRSILITGAAGYLGGLVTEALAARAHPDWRILAVDIRETPAELRRPGVRYESCDIRSDRLVELMAEEQIDSVIHLASIVTPPPGASRDFLYSVDVLGTQNLLRGCILHGVRHLILTSSGAAYGYHPDNPIPLTEDLPLRGNEAFAYSHHKRLVEEMLADYRRSYPALKQLIFRPGTILGERVSNQITKLFEGPVVLGIRGADSPFVFIWDQDVVRCILKGVEEQSEGIFNLAGDGALPLRELAAILGKRYLALPEALIASALGAAKRLGRSEYGPEQTMFLKHRPVLSNARLKSDFGYVPERSSEQTFRAFIAGRQSLASPPKPSTKETVVVTGGAGGIGRAIAERFGSAGARIALLDKNEEAVEQTAAELRAAGIEALGWACDVSSEQDCIDTIAAAREAFGPIDVLVNNAGMSHFSRVSETGAGVYRKLMDVNFFGAVHCTQAALPDLLARRGSVIVLSSIAGFAPLLDRSGYCASKHALHGFFETLRSELGERLHVLMVCPNFTATNIGKAAIGGDGGAAVCKRIELGTPATPASVAEAIHQATLRRRRTLVLSATGKLSWWTSKLLPRLYERIMVAKFQGQLDPQSPTAHAPGLRETAPLAS